MIPVLLAGSIKPERGTLPRFLRALTWVEFASAEDEDAIHRLLSGICGVAPGSSVVRSMPSHVSPYRAARSCSIATLAELYQVLTKNLNLAIRRNSDRFPDDFMFQLTKEAESLRLQIATSNVDRGGRRYLPYAFTQKA